MITVQEYPIGSTGFSQFGTHDYYEKQKFEGSFLLDYFRKNFTLHKYLRLKWKKYSYEGDYYCELCAYYYEEDLTSEEELELIMNDIDKLQEFDIESLEEKIQGDWNESKCKVVSINKKVA